jgi:hypothetical protein
VVTLRSRRRERALRSESSSLSADERVVQVAEAIVGRAWVERLLRHHDRMELALDAARETCRVAGDRLVEEQRYGRPQEISEAHAALELAIGAHGTVEAASLQAREALHTALAALSASTWENADSATAAQPRGDEPVLDVPSAATPGLRFQRTPLGNRASQAVRRARWRIGRLLALACGVRGPERPP